MSGLTSEQRARCTRESFVNARPGNHMTSLVSLEIIARAVRMFREYVVATIFIATRIIEHARRTAEQMSRFLEIVANVIEKAIFNRS